MVREYSCFRIRAFLIAFGVTMLLLGPYAAFSLERPDVSINLLSGVMNAIGVVYIPAGVGILLYSHFSRNAGASKMEPHAYAYITIGFGAVIAGQILRLVSYSL